MGIDGRVAAVDEESQLAKSAAVADELIDIGMPRGRLFSPSTATILLIPMVRRIAIQIKPIGPQPCTTTLELKRRIPVLFALSTA